MRDKKVRPGDVISIDLAPGVRFYAQALQSPLYRFFDVSQPEASLEDIAGAREIFSVWVSDKAIDRPNWKIIGNIALDICSCVSPWFYKIDKLNGNITKYRTDKNIDKGYEEFPIDIEEAKRLEAAAVWSGNHIEDRLKDWLNGSENKWVRSLRPPIK